MALLSISMDISTISGRCFAVGVLRAPQQRRTSVIPDSEGPWVGGRYCRRISQSEVGERLS